MGNFTKFADKKENLVTVVAFDPGETTGWCVMGAYPSAMNLSAMHNSIAHVEYGQVKCNEQPASGWEDTVHRHAGLMLWGENRGVTKMLDIVNAFPNSAILFEDFIPDERFDKARHTLSPVRITSAFCYGMDAQGFLLSKIHIMNRSLVKTTCTDLRLKNWGLYDSSSGPHARDAVRYAYYFLRDCAGTGIEEQRKRHHIWPHLFSSPDTGERIEVKKNSVRSKVGERIR